MATTALGIDIDCSVSSMIERSASAPSSPNERTSSVLREISNFTGHAKCRRVTFPDDDTIVTGYFDAPDPWSEDYSATMDNMVAAYRASCWKQGVKPLQRVLQQLQAAQMMQDTEFELNLKGENLDAEHCEALEEIFKRLQFCSLQLEDCHLNDEGAAALFDMIEYYDSTSHLNISLNKNIGSQGWHACSKMLKRTPCLQYLDASKTNQNEQSLLILGRAFRTGCYLHTLHLNNCGINGRPLVILVAALKLNSTLVELHLRENKMCSADGLQLGNLLRSNYTLQLLGLKSNNLQDLGVCHMVDGLCQQTASSGECLKNLDLSDTHLTKNGMAHVNRALLVSETLVSLNLSQNKIGDEGIQYMKQGLLTNQSLEELHLSEAKVTCEGAVALAEVIADNQRITTLDLTKNEIKLAGVLALALSMKHNQSMVCLSVDPTIKAGENLDELNNLQKHLEEIKQFCQRNSEQREREAQQSKKVNFVVQSANVPVIRSEAELTSLIREKTSSRSQSVGTNSVNAGMVSSASFPGHSKTGVPPASNSRNRFQVCRVYLDQDKQSQQSEAISSEAMTAEPGRQDSVQSNESVFLPSSPNESVPDNPSTTPAVKKAEDSVTREEFKKNYIRHQDSLAIHMQHAQSRRSNEDEEDEDVDEDSEHGDEATSPPEEANTKENEPSQSKLAARRSSGGKVVKKLTFILPDDYSEHSKSIKNNRRMSTPTLTANKLIQQKQKALDLKLGRQLESLDLRSSVPLSPTRLREGLIFPEPLDKNLN